MIEPSSYKKQLADPRWQKRRLKILERDNWRCTKCGSGTTELHVHHVGYAGTKPWHAPDSMLTTLCHDCHQAEHAPKVESSKPSAPSVPAKTVSARAFLPEEKVLLRLMLEHGLDITTHVISKMSFLEWTAGPPRDMAVRLMQMLTAGKIERKSFLDGTHGQALQILAAEVLTDVHEPALGWIKLKIEVPRLNEDPVATADSAMTMLKLDRIDEMFARVRMALDEKQSDDDLRRLSEHLFRLHDLRRRAEDRMFPCLMSVLMVTP